MVKEVKSFKELLGILKNFERFDCTLTKDNNHDETFPEGRIIIRCEGFFGHPKEFLLITLCRFEDDPLPHLAMSRETPEGIIDLGVFRLEPIEIDETPIEED